MILRYLKKRPDAASGQASYSDRFILSASLYQFIPAFIPIIVIALLSPTPFVIGAVFAILVNVAVHKDWINLHKRKEFSNQKTLDDTAQGVSAPGSLDEM